MSISKTKNKISSIFNLPFFTNKKYILSIWVIITIISSIKQFIIGNYNNYKIFKGVFYHTIDELNLYDVYPSEYFDHNHYGPVFSLLIAPFAVLPDAFGLVFWNIFNVSVLLFAILQLPLKSQQLNALLWICLNEFITTILGVQFNPIMTAIIILSYVYISKQKDFWAAFFIVLGVFVKLYGIVGLAFFFFSKNKLKFIASLFFWGLVLFALPMLISSPQYVVQSYQDWYERLILKNNENTGLNSYQDICLMGIVRRVFQDNSISNIPFLLGGMFLFGLQYIRIKYYQHKTYQLLMLASVLIFTVIFSSGSESPTYIIAFLGVGIWYVIQPKPVSKFKVFLLIFALILTSLSPTDLIPTYLKVNYIRPYALKALPCVIIWFVIVYEILTTKFDTINSKNENVRT